MFKQLEPMAKILDLKLNISTNEQGKMEVVIYFIPKGKSEMNLTPIFLRAMAEELDVEFVSTIEGYINKNLSTVERIEMLSKSIAEAEKSVTDKATSTPKKKKSTSSEKEKVKEVKEAEPIDMFTQIEGKAKIPTYTATGTITAKETPVDNSMSEEQIEMMEQQFKSATPIKPVVVKKDEEPVADPATSPKDVGEAKKKAQGLPFINRRGVLVNTDGTIHVPEKVVVELPKEVNTPPLSGMLIPETSFEVTGENDFDFSEVIIEEDPVQVLFDKISKLAVDNNIKLNGFVFEGQTLDKLQKLEIALNNHIKK